MEIKHTFFDIRRGLLLLLTIACTASQVMAQSTGTLSTYSRFGLGLRNDEALEWQRSMGGAGVAMPSVNRLNNLNPASYAFIDSLTFILDAGMTAGFGNMRQDGKACNVKGVTLDYVVAGFRLRRNLGLSFGFKPYSTVNYSFTSFTKENYREMSDDGLVNTGSAYTGSGGINKVFAGVGWRPFGHLSIGMHAGVLWGSTTNALGQGYTVNGTESSDYDGFNFYHTADFKSYLLDWGVQYATPITRQDWLTVGATVGLGHSLTGDAKLYRYLDNSTYIYAVDSTHNAYDIPMTYSLGLSWQHKNNLVVAADFHYDAWSRCHVPTIQSTGIALFYPSMQGMYKDNIRLNAGVEWIPDMISSRFYNRVRYRAGINWSSAYQYTKSKFSDDYSTVTGSALGPWEMNVNLGFGLPLTNGINYRAGIISQVNVGLGWLHRESPSADMVTENYFMLNIGVQFNERWFKKYKIQ